MNENETLALLAMIVTFDQRTVGEGDVAAWHAIATECDWTWPLARRAILEHHKRGGDRPRIKPGHITDAIEQARALIRRQVFTRDLVPPKELADDPRAELDWRRQRIAEVVERGLHAWATGDQMPQLEASPPATAEDLKNAEQHIEQDVVKGRFAMPRHARGRRRWTPRTGEHDPARDTARAELERIRRTDPDGPEST